MKQQQQTPHTKKKKKKTEGTQFTEDTAEQYTVPTNSSPSFSRELLKDQGTEPLQNKQALQILQ